MQITIKYNSNYLLEGRHAIEELKTEAGRYESAVGAAIWERFPEASIRIEDTNFYDLDPVTVSLDAGDLDDDDLDDDRSTAEREAEREKEIVSEIKEAALPTAWDAYCNGEHD
jgi:hypothetical protein